MAGVQTSIMAQTTKTNGTTKTPKVGAEIPEGSEKAFTLPHPASAELKRQMEELRNVYVNARQKTAELFPKVWKSLNTEYDKKTSQKAIQALLGISDRQVRNYLNIFVPDAVRKYTSVKRKVGDKKTSTKGKERIVRCACTHKVFMAIQKQPANNFAVIVNVSKKQLIDIEVTEGTDESGKGNGK